MVALLRRVPGRPDDVQPGAVAAGAVRRRSPRTAPATATSNSSLKPAADLDDRDIDFMLENFFHAQRAAHDRRLPALRRAAGAARRRCRRRPIGAARRRGSASTISATCRSGTSWRGSIRCTSRATRAFAALLEKGRGFSRGRQGAAARHRARAAEPRSSPSTATRPPAARSRSRRRRSTIRSCRCCATPTCICGRIPARGRRGSRSGIPRTPREQLERAADCHHRLFGRRPVGLWPSEGSVSDAMVPLVAAAGFSWMATDELILARTLGIDLLARRPGHVEQPERSVPAVPRPRRRGVGGVRVPRPRAVRSDRLHLRRLERRRGGRRLRGAPRRRPAGASRRGPAGRGR